MKKKDSRVIGVIPARFASSRFPGKMLVDIFGKSLIRRCYENARRSTRLDEIIVATDDIRILNHVEEFGGQGFMTSIHCPTGTDRVAEVVEKYFPHAEIIVGIQGDEPCICPSVIDQLIDKLDKFPSADMTTPVTPLSNISEVFIPSIVKCVFAKDGKALYFSRSPIPYPHKDQDITYYRHLGIYCFRRDFLLKLANLPKSKLQLTEDLEQLKILEHGYSIYVAEVEDEAVGVDTPEDLLKIKKILWQENTYLLQEESSPPLARV